MCGITGYIAPHPTNHQDYIDDMLDAIAKRGPDGNNRWTSDNVCLAHARLSIIDIEGSTQPLCNEDESIWITFNGEIYNYESLREDLIKKGHQFKTSGDTEVLVHLYEEKGEEMTSYLDGMFAFCIYDKKKHTLFCARDKVGIKPFYYWFNNGEFVFGSSMETILRNQNVERKLNYKAVGQYLHFGYTVPPLSFINSVYQLKPGEQVTWENGNITNKQYFKWQYQPDKSKSKDQWREHFFETMEESVYSQLVTSDVPVGSFLSGGVDSTSVSGIAQKILNRSNKKLETYTISSWYKQLDESERAAAIAKDLGTKHVQLHASEIKFNDDTIKQIIRAWGEPFGDTSSLNVLLLTQEVSKRAKVALSGDGGDEILFGYNGFRKQLLSLKLRRNLPSPIRKALAALTKNQSKDTLRRIHKYLNLSSLTGSELIIEWSKRWQDNDFDRISTPELLGKIHSSKKEPFPEVAVEINDVNTDNFLEKYINFHMKIDLSADCLYKTDRMSMENSLEVRVPVLSDAMINLSMELPFEYRTTPDKPKEFMKDLAGSMSATAATPSPKKGFGFPLSLWVQDGITEMWTSWGITDVLSDFGFSNTGLTDMMDEYNQTSKEDNFHRFNYLSKVIFDLLLLGIWLKSYNISK